MIQKTDILQILYDNDFEQTTAQIVRIGDLESKASYISNILFNKYKYSLLMRGNMLYIYDLKQMPNIEIVYKITIDEYYRYQKIKDILK